jgi:hypothetical protein
MVRFVVIAVALLGCGDKQLETLEEIRDEVCACKTPACGDAAMKKVPQDETKSTRKTRRVASEMLECLSKLYEVQPSTDPDAETPEPTSPGSAGSASGGTP